MASGSVIRLTSRQRRFFCDFEDVIYVEGVLFGSVFVETAVALLSLLVEVGDLRHRERTVLWYSSFFCLVICPASIFSTRLDIFCKVTSAAAVSSFGYIRLDLLEVDVLPADGASSFVRWLSRGVYFAVALSLTLLVEA